VRGHNQRPLVPKRSLEQGDNHFYLSFPIELEKHLHDPQPIPKTIKDTFQEFKRTHQDNWQEHKLKFTEDQLVVMTDLLVSPNYYA
jgi:hypothetical protein